MIKDYEAVIDKVEEYLEKKGFDINEKYRLVKIMEEQYWEEIKTEDEEEEPEEDLIDDPEEDPEEEPEDDPDEDLEKDLEDIEDKEEEDTEEEIDKSGHEKKATAAFQKPKVKIKR